MMLPLYKGLMTLGAPAIEIILSRRVERGKEDPARLCERRGIANQPRPDGELIWLHASSVGESVAALSLIDRLLRARADRHVLVTTGTVTSARMMADRLPDRSLHQFVPVDRPAWVERFLDHWRPNLALIMESEFWPTQITRTRARGIPIALVNARMSDRSFSRWRKANIVTKSLFSTFDLVLATNPDQGDQFRVLGAMNVQVPGNLKRAAAPLPLPPGDGAALSEQTFGRRTWFAASTHGGEDAPVINAHQQLRGEHADLLTIIAPRHPDRGADIAALALDRGLSVARRALGEPIIPETDIYIADTLGEMALFFDLAEIVFVAGSLVPVGGHNPIEPAHFDTAILLGPLMAKNAEIASEMIRQDAAITLTGESDLAPTVDMLLKDQARRETLAGNARRYVEGGNGVLDAILGHIEPILRSRSTGRGS
ncbi:MAG: 3-deoxy-D-manno-octulosonic acid transferase [Alphaproteobacteria bacterium]|jgi:3-deoxy-D-manno-octulosonic-acid transferase|nr:3-deoxy-D-manno-octulosonic acid transferase [Alphaproteobacteria bacterium]